MNEWLGEWGCSRGSDRDRQQEAAALQTARMEEAVRQIAATPDGRYFLRRLVLETGVFSAGYPAGHAEAAFLEGKRIVGLTVLRYCAAVGAGDIFMSNEEHNHG